jgi:hypothetical protein
MITIPSAKGFCARQPLTEQATITTIRSSGTFRLLIQIAAYEGNLTNRRVTVVWWDGTKTTQNYDAVYTVESAIGEFTVGIPYTFSKAVSSPYNNANPKTVRVFISDTSGNVRPRDVNAFISYIDVTDDFFYQDNGVTAVNIAGLDRLLEFYSNLNDSFSSISTIPNSIQVFTITSSSLLTSLDISNHTNLTSLYVNLNPSLSSLNVSGCSSLSVMYVYSNTSLSSLTISGLSNLKLVDAYGNSSMTSIRAVGVGGVVMTQYYSYSTFSSFFAGIRVSECNLNGAALDQLYTDLNSIPPGSDSSYIVVRNQGNGGELNDNPSIATNKNYTVLGT